MKTCPVCGAVSSDGVLNCVNCGAQLSGVRQRNAQLTERGEVSAADDAYGPAQSAAAPVDHTEQKKKLNVAMWAVFAVLTALSLAFSAFVMFKPMFPRLDVLEGVSEEMDAVAGGIQRLRDAYEGEELEAQIAQYLKQPSFEKLGEKDVKTLSKLMSREAFSFGDLIRLVKLMNIRDLGVMVNFTLGVVGISIGLMILLGLLACVTKNKALAVIYLILAILAVSIGKLPDIAAAVAVLVCVSKYKAAEWEETLSAESAQNA